MSNYSEFKRLNFFPGFFTTAEDWNDGEKYHREKRKLHNRGLHQPGIIEGLEVKPDKELTVIVEKGAALDQDGNLIYLAKDTTVTLERPGSGSARIYITIEYDEKESDHVFNVQDPDYSGNTRVVEQPILRALRSVAANQVQLASVNLDANAQEIKEPGDPTDPKENEIDRRQVVQAGAKDSRRDHFVAAVKERIKQLHHYHQARQQRQNRGLHKPGVLRTVQDELNVVKVPNSLAVRVLPGAALDGEGNQIYLDETRFLPIKSENAPYTVYIAVQYDDSFMDYLADLTKPFSGSLHAAKVEASQIAPDNVIWIELARIAVGENAIEFSEPKDPANPQVNEIDQRARRWSGSIGLVPPRLPPDLQERLNLLMLNTRQNFVLLTQRFPSPAVDDVRQIALQIQMALDCLEPEQLPNRIKVMAAVEQDVEQELGKLYPRLLLKPEFAAYATAIAALLQALQMSLPLDKLLTCQQSIAEAARNLAQVVFPPPTADAGSDQTVVTETNAASVRLDASNSQAASGHRIVSYRWDKEQ